MNTFSKTLKTNCILRVFYIGGGVRWYRVKKGRKIDALMNYFYGIQHFHYAKLYEYKDGPGNELGYFGVNPETGEIYQSTFFL